MVRQPLLLAPFIAVATSSKCSALTWQGVQINVSRDGFETVATDQSILAEYEECRLTHSNRDILESGRSFRVPEFDAEYVAILGNFAARTYAPASDRSRAGAGSSLSDND
jgi:hypothetical protein